MKKPDVEHYENKENQFQMGWYDTKGNINKKRFFNLFVCVFVFVPPVFIYLLVFLKTKLSQNIDITNDFLKYVVLLFENYSQIINDEGIESVIKNHELILFTLCAYLIPRLLFMVFNKYIKHKAEIQSILSSIGASQYYLKNKNDDTRKYTFKLIKGETADFEIFQNRVDDLKQFFDVGDIKTARSDKDLVELEFKAPFPDISYFNKHKNEIDFNNEVGEGRLLIGVSDIQNNKYIHGTKKEQGKGLNNGHWKIVGGSGSGKSFLVTSMLKNYLIPENYINIYKIYIINFKKSSDYNFIKKLDKVEYVEEISDALRILKKVVLEMTCKYRYNSIHSTDNFLSTQTLLVIDEIQTIQEMLTSKSLHPIMKNTLNEMNALLEMISSKSRRANDSMMIILQQATVNSLPSTAFRQNIRNSILLKQENDSSAHLVINKDILEKENIKPTELKQGQFLYYDSLTARCEKGFAFENGIQIDYDLLNNIEFTDEVKKVMNEVESYKKLAIEVVKLELNFMNKLDEQDKKTFCDSFEDIDKERDDLYEVAIRNIEMKNGDKINP